MRPLSSRRRRRKTSMPSGGLSRKTTGTPPTEWKRKSSPVVAGWPDTPLWNQAAGHNAAAGAVPDRHEFPNRVIVYHPETVPLQVVAVLHGKRKLKEVPERRSV